LSGAMPDKAGVAAGVEFCRLEIERRRDYFRRVLLWGFGPVLLSIGTFILALALAARAAMFPNAMPFIVLVIAWMAIYFFSVRVREQRQLQRDIDELNEIARGNSL
jgi:hypothetical protein